MLQGLAGISLEQQTLRRQTDTAVIAHKKRYPHLLLQLPDGATEGRGTEVADLPGTAEMQRLGQGEEKFELSCVHVCCEFQNTMLQT